MNDSNFNAARPQPAPVYIFNNGQLGATYPGQPCYNPAINSHQQSAFCHSNISTCSSERPTAKCNIYVTCWVLAILINSITMMVTALTSMPEFISLIIVPLIVGAVIHPFTLFFFACGRGPGSAFYLVCGPILIVWHFSIAIILFLQASGAIHLSAIYGLSNLGAVFVGILHLVNIINYCVVCVAMYRIYRGDYEPKLPIIRTIITKEQENVP